MISLSQIIEFVWVYNKDQFCSIDLKNKKILIMQTLQQETVIPSSSYSTIFHCT